MGGAAVGGIYSPLIRTGRGRASRLLAGRAVSARELDRRPKHDPAIRAGPA